MSEPNWNYMARAMQRPPFNAQGTEEAIEHGLKIAAGIPSEPPPKHDFKPNFPGDDFCGVCGWVRDEPLMHNQ